MKKLPSNKADISLPRKIPKVTLVGLGASVYDWITFTYADFPDQGEIWTINAGGPIFRHDILWDMHSLKWLTDRKIERALKRHEYLKKHDKPIMMPKYDPEIPMSVTFPLKEIIEKTNSAYFSCGAAYPLAMAYCCDVEILRIFGFDFSYERDTNTHDEQGRACAEYWIGRLVQKGVRIEVTNNTHFLDMKTRSTGQIYGYDEPLQFDFPINGGKGTFVGPDYINISDNSNNIIQLTERIHNGTTNF